MKFSFIILTHAYMRERERQQRECVCVLFYIITFFPLHSIHYFGGWEKKDFRFMFEKKKKKCKLHFGAVLWFSFCLYMLNYFPTFFSPFHTLFTNEWIDWEEMGTESERERKKSVLMLKIFEWKCNNVNEKKTT